MKHRIQFLRRRREFITLIVGGAVAWPLAARAQQPAKRTLGYLSPRSSEVETRLVINLKTAKAPGLTIPPGLMAIADEVIE